jgi:hypothetical protein
MGIPGKPMLVSLGIFIGLIFFGVNISLINFNRLVAPEHPLCLVDWQIGEERVEILLLGEPLRLPLDGDLFRDAGERACYLLRQGRIEAAKWLDLLRQKACEMKNRPWWPVFGLAVQEPAGPFHVTRPDAIIL